MLLLLDIASFVWTSRNDGAPLGSGIKTSVNLNHEVYYHFLGTDQSEDLLCWEDPDHPKYIYTPEVSEDGKVFCNYGHEAILVTYMSYS